MRNTKSRIAKLLLIAFASISLTSCCDYLEPEFDPCSEQKDSTMVNLERELDEPKN